MIHYNTTSRGQISLRILGTLQLAGSPLPHQQWLGNHQWKMQTSALHCATFATAAKPMHSPDDICESS